MVQQLGNAGCSNRAWLWFLASTLSHLQLPVTPGDPRTQGPWMSAGICTNKVHISSHRNIHTLPKKKKNVKSSRPVDVEVHACDPAALVAELRGSLEPRS